MRGDVVADELLELLDVGEAAVGGARPDGFGVEADFENASRAGPQGDFAQLGFKGGEQLLRHPGRAKQPAALSAVFDFDAGAKHPIS